MLREKRLFRKPSSLMFMTTRDTEPADIVVPLFFPDGNESLVGIPTVEKMEVLGTMLHKDGDSETA